VESEIYLQQGKDGKMKRWNGMNVEVAAVVPSVLSINISIFKSNGPLENVLRLQNWLFTGTLLVAAVFGRLPF
jgi:hypothetical protein